jgi:ribosomal protein S28E/S33
MTTGRPDGEYREVRCPLADNRDMGRVLPEVVR